MAPPSAPGDEFEIRLLGPFEITRRGVPVDVGGDRVRVVLASLALAAGTVVPADALIDHVWGERLPGDPRGGLQNLMTRLRKLLTVDVIRSVGRGYLLEIPAEQIDVVRFTRLLEAAADARSAGDSHAARTLLAQARQLWRGDPLTGVESEALRSGEVQSLTERYLASVEQSIDMELADGLTARLAPELVALTTRHPLRESLWLRLIKVLHRLGRKSEALTAYHSLRTRLAEELGVQPSPELQEAYQAILNSDLAEPRGAQAVPTDDDPATAPVTRLPRGVAGPMAAPRQLPATVSGFVGRAEELAVLDGEHKRFLEVRDGARPVMLAVIHGAGGVGKTALALHWAHGIADRFPDGQVYLDLRGYGPTEPVTAGDALSTMLRGFGVPDPAVPVAVEERAALLRTVLADRRVVMVLDNVSSADHVRPLLPGSDSVVVVTSRDQLRGLSSREGATSLALRELSELDARQLLADTVGATRVGSQPRAAAELAALCGRLPLALRITAHLASQYPELPLSQLAADLRSQRLDAFADHADPAADPRAVFSWSYRALSADDARVFRLLSLAPGDSIGLPAAAVLLDIPLAETRGALQRLVSVHLLESPQPGRFRFHDLLRVYAAERTAAEDSPEVRGSALRGIFKWYVAAGYAAEAALRPGLRYYEDAQPPSSDHVPHFADAIQAITWYDAERESLLAAVRKAAEVGEHDIAYRLAIVPMSGFFLTRPLWHELLAVLDLALESAHHAADVQAQAALLTVAATIRSFLGSDDEALAMYEQGLELYRSCGARAQEGMALAMLAALHGSQGRHEQAMPIFEEAVKIAIERDDELREAHALSNMAISLTGLGRLQESVRASQRTLDIRVRHNDRRSKAFNLDNLGDAYHEMGEYARAAECYSEALAIARELGDRRGEAIYLANLTRTRSHLVPLHDTRGRAGLAATAREASEALADLPDMESRRLHERLREAFPDLEATEPTG